MLESVWELLNVKHSIIIFGTIWNYAPVVSQENFQHIFDTSRNMDITHKYHLTIFLSNYIGKRIPRDLFTSSDCGHSAVLCKTCYIKRNNLVHVYAGRRRSHIESGLFCCLQGSIRRISKPLYSEDSWNMFLSTFYNTYTRSCTCFAEKGEPWNSPR